MNKDPFILSCNATCCEKREQEFERRKDKNRHDLKIERDFRPDQKWRTNFWKSVEVFPERTGLHIFSVPEAQEYGNTKIFYRQPLNPVSGFWKNISFYHFPWFFILFSWVSYAWIHGIPGPLIETSHRKEASYRKLLEIPRVSWIRALFLKISLPGTLELWHLTFSTIISNYAPFDVRLICFATFRKWFFVLSKISLSAIDDDGRSPTAHSSFPDRGSQRPSREF